jgi:hypothetical protein
MMMTMYRSSTTTIGVAGLLLLASVAVLLPVASASGCHGKSRFRLAPETISAPSADTLKKAAQWWMSPRTRPTPAKTSLAVMLP